MSGFIGSRLVRRRELLAGIAVTVLITADHASAKIIRGELPWSPGAGSPPSRESGGWRFFTPAEAAAVEALVDRIIPPDPTTSGGKDAGCGVFIDRQLAGPYGSSAALYMHPPFAEGTPQQGDQSALTPSVRYRQGLAALDKHCRAAFAGKAANEITDDERDQLLTGLENRTVTLEGADGHAFFEQLLKDAKEGFFSDPIYGGNRDMAGWKMIGFPGARYDLRDWVERHNEKYPHPPVSISGQRG